MITVDEARATLFDLAGTMPVEQVPLIEACGRVLAHPVTAGRDQPPFAASSMDGYAVKTAEVQQHAMFKVIGEAAAGRRFDGALGAGQAVRIFTGSPMPEGADFVVIQEDVNRTGDLITVVNEPGSHDNVRPLGGDFRAGLTVPAPRLLRPNDLALLAAMNIDRVPVHRKPVVALISTGDELVMPGDTPGPDQIIASNAFALKALFEEAGAQVRLLPIAPDSIGALTMAFGLAEGADLIVTIGGASVGDHDLVGRVAETLGMERAFYKVKMRPGKPLMAGRLNGAAMVGLPGNPVSAIVCGHVFVVPMIRSMLGLGAQAPVLKRAELATDLPANGPREHYMRAEVNDQGWIGAADDQDSSFLTILAGSNALLRRPCNDPARAAGEVVEYLPI
ncbi:MAG: gephyrin-like molybdotransferase Glp [Pseudodonghicola sp.]|uniref:molybdopterin molybdotransferase MoeA n=1 Tax=Pseudodonghicola sp. TaxID=1969463 RepID=UPI003A9822B1